jgi:hypothetical protein
MRLQRPIISVPTNIEGIAVEWLTARGTCLIAEESGLMHALVSTEHDDLNDLMIIVVW